ncbi:MAG TPA: hypothetical protein VLK84_09320 [Longimicrobium sp.]|nr:hypothetical protein [Longimicrobium sp.]
MLPLVLIAMLVICLPVVLRIARFLVKANVVLVALFLPAGLLLRSGRLDDPQAYLAVTALWGVVLLALMVRRRSATAA